MKSNRWKKWDAEKLFLFQISQERLCTDFGAFHKATEEVLKRPVWSHEFAFPETLMQEYIEKKKANLKMVFDKLPKDMEKLVVIT